jgi:hypothetical protein
VAFGRGFKCSGPLGASLRANGLDAHDQAPLVPHLDDAMSLSTEPFCCLLRGLVVDMPL